MVNNNNKMIPDKNQYRAVETATYITCGKCKKIYDTCVEEISFKNPNYYYINCIVCRTKMTDYTRKYKKNILYK